MEIQFERLTEPFHPAYLGMTFAEHRLLLCSLSRSSEILAIGATAEGEPVGLGLTRLDEQGTVGTILSLLIIPSLQGRGLGTALLEVLENVLTQAGCGCGRIYYNTELPCAGAMERIVQKAGWSTPRRHMLIVRVRDCSGGEIRRRLAEIRPDPRLHVFPWVDLTPHERSVLEDRRADIPASVWPFHEEDAPLEPAVSLGLKHGTEVIGWLLAHRVTQTQIRFTSVYVYELWRSTKAFLTLFLEAERRYRELRHDEMQPTLGVLADNALMIRLVERHFRPFCHPFQEIRIAEKVLTRR